MAPPTPVYDKFEVASKYQKQLNDPDKYKCTYKSITQHECTFKLTYPVHANQVPQAICLPFKREFQRCLFRQMEKNRDGKKQRVDKWVNIEITDENTNQQLFTDPKYSTAVKEFLQADKDLKKMLEEEIKH